MISSQGKCWDCRLLLLLHLYCHFRYVHLAAAGQSAAPHPNQQVPNHSRRQFNATDLPSGFSQLVDLAPYNPLGEYFKFLLNLTSFALESVMRAEYGYFWVMEIIAFVLIMMNVLISVLKIFHVDFMLRRWRICSDLWYFVDLFLPIFSNSLFLPVVSVLLSNFPCSRSTGTAFTESFLDRDCAERCWAGTHVKYTAMATICLLVYIPIQLITKPMWEEMQENLSRLCPPFTHKTPISDAISRNCHISQAKQPHCTRNFLLSGLQHLFSLPFPH